VGAGIGETMSVVDEILDLAVAIGTLVPRVRDQPGIDENLRGYFITAFRRRVRHRSMRENRLAYEGLVSQLEFNHHLTGPNFEEIIEQRLCLEVIIDLLPHEARHMLHFRILEFSWNEIGRRLGISAKQARSRFYYELEKVHSKLLQSKTGNVTSDEESD
jgi:DNA-directed RNA polymerase specialized sigma24 family protein